MPVYILKQGSVGREQTPQGNEFDVDYNSARKMTAIPDISEFLGNLEQGARFIRSKIGDEELLVDARWRNVLACFEKDGSAQSQPKGTDDKLSRRDLLGAQLPPSGDSPVW